jgi:hypothetical protein
MNSQVKKQKESPIKVVRIFKDAISKLQVVVYEQNGEEFMYLINDKGCEFFIHPGSFQLEEVGQN